MVAQSASQIGVCFNEKKHEENQSYAHGAQWEAPSTSVGTTSEAQRDEARAQTRREDQGGLLYFTPITGGAGWVLTRCVIEARDRLVANFEQHSQPAAEK